MHPPSTLAFVAFLAGCSAAVGEHPQQPGSDLDDVRVRAEIVDLHRFFVAWFRGELPRTEEAFRALPAALSDGFVIVSPSGQLSPRADVLDGVRGAHASWPETDDIRIEHVVVRRRTDATVIATYEEWQRRGSEERGRLSTVVFDADLHWVHLHETWLPGPPRSTPAG